MTAETEPKPKLEPEYWYRYEDYRTAPPVDEYGDVHGPSTLHIRLVKYEVISHTPKGVWLRVHTQFSDKRFVLRQVNKRFACPTILEAKESFIARKKRQAQIFRARYEGAEDAIRKIQGGSLLLTLFGSVQT